ncbi:MAG: hypothetical protein GXP31_01155 [Kiritimatiellaeota bacterium]|nr:hypothetical protein [Kiritimatiellota bacterium]
MGLIARIFGYIWDFFLGAAVNILEAGLDTDPRTLILIFVGVTVVLGSACWASSIAEARLYSPKLHFFIGLFAPVLYPVILLFAMDVKYPGAVRQPPGEAPETPPVAPPAEPQEVETDAGEDTGENVVEYDQAYFREIARDEAGNFVGPWRIDLADNAIVAQRILDALPHAVVIETVPHGPNSKPQRLRIPYDKIESCVRA